jgi:chromosome segregation ATPase
MMDELLMGFGADLVGPDQLVSALKKLKEIDADAAESLKDAINACTRRSDQLADKLSAHQRNLEQRLTVLQGELQQQNRIATERLDVIYKIERQRNEWLKLYHEQSDQHHAAQIALESWLTEARKMLKRALDLLNDYRKKDGLEPVKSPEQLDATLSHAEGYRRLTERLQREATPLLDNNAELSAAFKQSEQRLAADAEKFGVPVSGVPVSGG